MAKSRKTTSTFSSATRAMTTIGAIPVSAGLGVFHGVAGVFHRLGDKEHEEVVAPETQSSHAAVSNPVSAGLGVLHGVAGVFKRGDKEHEEVVAPETQSSHATVSNPVSAGLGVLHGVAGVFKRGDKEHEETVVPEIQSGQISHAAVSNNHVIVADTTFPSSDNGHPAVGEPGTLKVIVLDAKSLHSHDIKPYATIRVGDREFKTKHTGKTDTPEWSALWYLGFNQ